MVCLVFIRARDLTSLPLCRAYPLTSLALTFCTDPPCHKYFFQTVDPATKTCVASDTVRRLAITLFVAFAVAELGLHLLHRKYATVATRGGGSGRVLRRSAPRVGGNLAAGNDDGDEGPGLVVAHGAGALQMRWRAQRLQ